MHIYFDSMHGKETLYSTSILSSDKWHHLPVLMVAGLMAADPAPAEEQVPDPKSDTDGQSGPKQSRNFLTFKDLLQV